jgi:5-methylcytosine-specific restriction endonuclease McrA
MTPNFKRRIYFASQGICGICQTMIDLRLQYPNPKSFSIDHIIPRSLGGTHGAKNLQAAHLDCNARRGNKPLES